MSFRYSRNSDRVTSGSWVMVTGTERTGYEVDHLENSDPSDPLWITETSLRVAKDFGSAQRVDELYIFGHNLRNSAAVKVQMHTSNSWGTPDVSVDVTIPDAYEDGFIPGVRVDLAAVYPTAGDRTKRWLSIVNTVANAETVYIGEVWIQAIAARSLQCDGVKWGPKYPHTRITSRSKSKRGVQTVYDHGSIERALIVEFPARAQDYADLRSLEIDARYDARPVIVTLDDSSSTVRAAEPMLSRITKTTMDDGEQFGLSVVKAEFEELGRGELLGA